MLTVKKNQNLKCFRFLWNSTDLWHIYFGFEEINFEISSELIPLRKMSYNK